MRTAVSVIAYAATYGVPLITSSRVPAILPTRPLAGKSINRRTAATIRSSTRIAADGFSASMYVNMASRSDNAKADQVSFTIFENPR
ncbi:hypothetical protein AMC87_PD00778 (plasmid) [Rhizobium phaseoli]|nr:hypothetical protein AMC87_PD00778 [Rhizobium phaseoli]